MKLVYNYVLISAVISWALAQIIKTTTHIIKFRTFNPERLVGAGGMPSSHSSLVCSALVAVGRKMGLASCEFAIMFIIAAVVMYDAMGVRHAAGLHAIEINKFNKYFSDIFSKDKTIEAKEETDKKTKLLKEHLGHTPLEVTAGAILGIAVACIMPVK